MQTLSILSLHSGCPARLVVRNPSRSWAFLSPIALFCQLWGISIPWLHSQVSPWGRCVASLLWGPEAERSLCQRSQVSEREAVGIWCKPLSSTKIAFLIFQLALSFTRAWSGFSVFTSVKPRVLLGDLQGLCKLSFPLRSSNWSSHSLGRKGCHTKIQSYRPNKVHLSWSINIICI